VFRHVSTAVNIARQSSLEVRMAANSFRTTEFNIDDAVNNEISYLGSNSSARNCYNSNETETSRLELDFKPIKNSVHGKEVRGKEVRGKEVSSLSSKTKPPTRSQAPSRRSHGKISSHTRKSHKVSQRTSSSRSVARESPPVSKVPSSSDLSPVTSLSLDAKSFPKRAHLIRFRSDSSSSRRSRRRERALQKALNKAVTRKDAQELTSQWFGNDEVNESIPKDFDILQCARNGDANQIHSVVASVWATRRKQKEAHREMERIFKRQISDGSLTDTDMESKISSSLEVPIRIDVDHPRDKKGCTALMIASAYNDLRTVITLYGAGANLEAKNIKGYTPLAVAAFFCKVECFEKLLEFGADPTARTNRGDSVLVVAANQICQAKSEKKYLRALAVCKIIIERTERRWRDGRRYIEEYTEEDDRKRRIYDHRSRRLIQEWVESKGKMMDLHFPPYSLYKSSKQTNTKRMENFFRRSHGEMNYAAWVKITLLLLFIIYDFVLNGISRNLSIYILLYICAYAL